MIFLFKKTKITIDAFTKVPGVKEFYPIASSKKFFPDWWKKLPKTHNYVDSNGISIEHPTIKSCDGLIEIYKNGIIIPLWADIILKTGFNGQWAFHTPQPDTKIENHPRVQYGDTFDKYIHVKIVSPWFLSEKTGCKFYFAPSIWNLTSHYNDFTILSGIVNYKFQGDVNINMFFNKIEKQTFLEAGTPFVHLIPLSDKEVNVKCHTLSEEEYNKRVQPMHYRGKFASLYKSKKKILESQSKCPFGFN